jgi:hypothetical protein
MSKQTTKKIERFEGQITWTDDEWILFLRNRVAVLTDKINEIIDHINKEGKHE